MSAAGDGDAAADGAAAAEGCGRDRDGAAAGGVVYQQCSGGDVGRAAVGIGGGEGECSGSDLIDGSASADDVGERAGGGLVEGEGCVVGDVALQAGGVALQRSAG